MNLYRAQGVLDLEMVRRTKIAFWGLGSLGSLTLANLAYPWKEIVLCDPDTLKDENVERHLLGKPFVGKPKAESLALWLVNDRGLDPKNTKITVNVGRAQEFLDQHQDADLSIVSVDSTRAKSDINVWAMKGGITSIYGGIYPKGVGGKLTFLPFPQEICYQCASIMIGADYHGKEPGHDYGIDPTTLQDDEGDLKAVPSLRKAVDTIAADMADFALDFVQGETQRAEIQIHAIDDWIPFMEYPSQDDALGKLMAFVGNQPNLGLSPKMRIQKMGGVFQLLIAEGVQSLVLAHQKDCQYHSTKPVSLDEI